MSCKACDQRTEGWPSAGQVFVRVGNGNVLVLGCEDHVRQLLAKTGLADAVLEAVGEAAAEPDASTVRAPGAPDDPRGDPEPLGPDPFPQNEAERALDRFMGPVT